MPSWVAGRSRTACMFSTEPALSRTPSVTPHSAAMAARSCADPQVGSPCRAGHDVGRHLLRRHRTGQAERHQAGPKPCAGQHPPSPRTSAAAVSRLIDPDRRGKRVGHASAALELGYERRPRCSLTSPSPGAVPTAAVTAAGERSPPRVLRRRGGHGHRHWRRCDLALTGRRTLDRGLQLACPSGQCRPRASPAAISEPISASRRSASRICAVTLVEPLRFRARRRQAIADGRLLILRGLHPGLDLVEACVPP